MLTISNDGWVEIMKIYQGEMTSLCGGFVDAQIDPVRNHLQGFCIGDRIILYVNGELAAEAQDGDLISGDVGVEIGNYDEPQVVIDFDNFFVYKAQGDFTTSFPSEPAMEARFSLDLGKDWVVSYSDDLDTPNKGN